MGWGEPPISGEVWDNVVRGKFPLIDSDSVRAYATGYGSFQSVVEEAASEMGAVAKICGESFGGTQLVAPEEKYAKLGQDGDGLASRAESWAARLGRVADLIDEAQQKIVSTVLVVAQQVAQLTGRNRDRNEIAVQLQALYDEGHKQVCAIYDALLENPDLAMPDDSESSDDGDDMSMGDRAEAVATTQERAQAMQRVESQIKPSEQRESETSLDDRDGKPAEREQKDDVAQRQDTTAQPVAQSGGQAAGSNVPHESSKAAAQHTPSASAGTHLQSSLAAPHTTSPQGAGLRPEPAQGAGPAPLLGAQAPPAQAARRTATTSAQTGAAVQAGSARPDSARRHDGSEPHDAVQERHELADGSAATSAMGAAALAPPPTPGSDHTPWSASDPNRVAPSGHFLGAGETGGAGVRDGYLLTGEDPDQWIVDQTCEYAAAVAGAAEAARSMWGVLPPCGWVVAGFKDVDGAPSYRAFPHEGLGWAHPGTTLPFGVALGLNIDQSPAPLDLAAHEHPAATVLDWLRWARVGQPGSGAALVCLASTAPVPHELGWSIRALNEHMDVEELRREAVVRDVVAGDHGGAKGGGAGYTVSRLDAVNQGVADFLATLHPQALVPVGVELALSCIDDTAAERRPEFSACSTAFRNGAQPHPQLLASVREAAAQAQSSMSAQRAEVERMPNEDRAIEMWAYLDKQAVLSASFAAMAASHLPSVISEPLARRIVADIAYEHLIIGGDHASVRDCVHRAFQAARNRAAR